MKTLLQQPFFAYVLMQLLEHKRITKDLFDEAMDDTKLAKLIVRHELAHDYYALTKLNREDER